ncbi:hypothetical protein FXW07_14315 [Methanosarcina sp. DH1]|nr:hypothetical protein [Methanosarcina sp. DH1]MCC4767743.1 hypothetical protein [Methanosarcina sp. DH1]
MSFASLPVEAIAIKIMDTIARWETPFVGTSGPSIPKENSSLCDDRPRH